MLSECSTTWLKWFRRVGMGVPISSRKLQISVRPTTENKFTVQGADYCTKLVATHPNSSEGVSCSSRSNTSSVKVASSNPCVPALYMTGCTINSLNNYDDSAYISHLLMAPGTSFLLWVIVTWFGLLLPLLIFGGSDIYIYLACGQKLLMQDCKTGYLLWSQLFLHSIIWPVKLQQIQKTFA